MSATILGIAVCAMYSSGAMVLLDGLAEGSSSVLARIETGPFLAYRGSFPELEPLGEQVHLGGGSALGRLETATLRVENSTFHVRLFSISDLGILSLSKGPQAREAFLTPTFAGKLGIEEGQVVNLASAEKEGTLVFAGFLKPAVPLPEGWVLVSEGDLRELFPSASAAHNFALVNERKSALDLEGQGLTVLSLTSAGDFFLLGLEEARRIVFSIVVASSIAIAALAFSLLSLEVRYRRREIETLRALGMGGRDFLKLYGLQMAFILSAGTILGISMGIVVANGLVSFSPFFGLTTVIRPQVTPAGVLIPLLSSLFAGLAGGTSSILYALRRLTHEAKN